MSWCTLFQRRMDVVRCCSRALWHGGGAKNVSQVGPETVWSQRRWSLVQARLAVWNSGSVPAKSLEGTISTSTRAQSFLPAEGFAHGQWLVTSRRNERSVGHCCQGSFHLTAKLSVSMCSCFSTPVVSSVVWRLPANAIFGRISNCSM